MIQKKRKLGKCALLVALAVGLAGTSFAAQFDAPYYEFQKKNGAEWDKEDKAVEAKLAALEDKFGKKPNIIYILVDDIGHGELGVQGGGAARGAPTPQIDRMAQEGIILNGFYSEPSCTPTRVALMTGRHPVRTGLTDVIFPGNPAGLSPEEVTIAEVLSEAGYATAMFGKWHLGEGEETWPHNQGFDETLFGVYNTAPWAWNTPGDTLFWNNENTPEFFTRYHLNGEMEAKKGGKAREIAPLNLESLATFEEETFKRSVDFIKRNAKGEKPFFLYLASNFVSMMTVHPDWKGKSPQGTNSGDQFMEHDHYVGQLLRTLEDLGIAENTLVVWMSDNGPMYDIFPESSSSAYRGGKGDVLKVECMCLLLPGGQESLSRIRSVLGSCKSPTCTPPQRGSVAHWINCPTIESLMVLSRAATCWQQLRVVASTYSTILARSSVPLDWDSTSAIWPHRMVGCRARIFTIFIKTRKRNMVSWHSCFGPGCRSTISHAYIPN